MKIVKLPIGKDIKKRLILLYFCLQSREKNPNPNHLFMSTNSNHIVFVLVVTKEEVKQQIIKPGKDPSNLYPAI